MSGVCALVTKAELEYWGIDELLLEPCCALKYYPEIELCCKGKFLSSCSFSPQLKVFYINVILNQLKIKLEYLLSCRG